MTTLPAETLEHLMTGALRARGLSEEHAGYVVDGLVLTSLRGVDTHGVTLFPTYLAELDGGRALANPDLSWRGAPGSALRVLDAGGALGLVAGRIAVDEAVRLAGRHGIGAVSVHGSNHFGAASYYTLEIARHGQIGLCFSNSDALVAPWNGRDPTFGTNPLSLAARTEDDLFCADFATSQVSYTKVKRHRELNLPVEPGWALDRDGRDLASQPEDTKPHALRPLGNHKGQCLSMLVEILTAVLAGGAPDHELSHLYSPPFDRPRNVSHFFLSIDPGAVGEPAGFRSRLGALLETVRARSAAGDEPVMAPGDPETACHARRAVEGIPLSDAEREWFLALDATGPEQGDSDPGRAYAARTGPLGTGLTTNDDQ